MPQKQSSNRGCLSVWDVRISLCSLIADVLDMYLSVSYARSFWELPSRQWGWQEGGILIKELVVERGT